MFFSTGISRCLQSRRLQRTILVVLSSTLKTCGNSFELIVKNVKDFSQFLEWMLKNSITFLQLGKEFSRNNNLSLQFATQTSLKT